MPPKITILFVDDDAMNCKVFKRYFSKAQDIEVFTALSALQALELLAQKNLVINIIISDQRMPHMKGHELLSKVKTSHPATFRALTSANCEEIDTLLSESSKLNIIQKFIEKPWDFNQIKEVIYSIHEPQV